MRSIDLPSAQTRDQCDEAFAAARASSAGHSAGNIAYRLLSRGAFPSNPRELIERIRAGDSEAIDEAVGWLSFDPFCLWSGYLKQQLMRSLAQQKMSTGQAERIRQMLLDVLPRGRRMEFRTACRLARSVVNEPFVDRLGDYIAHADADTRQRAQWMLGGCERALDRS